MKSIFETTCIYKVKPCDVIYFLPGVWFRERGCFSRTGSGTPESRRRTVQTKRHKIKESLETRVSHNLVKLRTGILNDRVESIGKLKSVLIL